MDYDFMFSYARAISYVKSQRPQLDMDENKVPLILDLLIP